jgi:hypothetical protein
LEKEVDEEDILVSDNIQMIYLGTDAWGDNAVKNRGFNC